MLQFKVEQQYEKGKKGHDFCETVNYSRFAYFFMHGHFLESQKCVKKKGEHDSIESKFEPVESKSLWVEWIFYYRFYYKSQMYTLFAKKGSLFILFI